MDVFRPDVKAGLFISLAVIIFLVVLFRVGGWLERLHPSQIIQTQFHHSQGVKPGDEVQYLGKKVGRVESVEFSQDARSVLVVCAVDPQLSLLLGTRARINDKSMLGGKLVELIPPENPDQAKVMPLDHVIPGSLPGGLSGLLSVSHEAITGIKPRLEATFNRLDRVLDQLGDGLSSAQQGLDSLGELAPDIHALLDNYNELADELSENVTFLTRQVNGSLDTLTPKTEGVMTDLQSLIAQLQNDEAELKIKLDQVLEQSRALISETRGLVGDNAHSLNASLRTLESTLTELESFSATIAQKPNAIIFGKKRKTKTHPRRER